MGGSPDPPSWRTTHTGFPPFEVFVDLDRRLRSQLHLPDSFAAAVDTDDDRPTSYWLQVDGCPNGPSWVEVEFIVDDSMLLGRVNGHGCRLEGGVNRRFKIITVKA